MVKDLFKKALELMFEEEEFDRIISHSANLKEKRAATKDKEMLEAISNSIKIEEYPFIPLLASISSADVFRDVIVYMAEIENRIVKGIEKDGK